MCWYSDKKPVALVAEEDFVCYKYTETHKVEEKRKYLFGILGPIVKVIHSDIRNYLYYLHRKNPRVYINVEPHGRRYSIEEGYHSLLYMPRMYKTFAILKCTIPKGTIYYKNEWNELVSEQIIINKIIDDEKVH